LLFILFGSRAIGDNLDKSDIDLAFVAPDMTEAEWAALSFDIEDRLDTLLLLDLVKYEKAPEQLKDEINKHGKILYRKKGYPA
jgi:predicted nucleotidyltransferase